MVIQDSGPEHIQAKSPLQLETWRHPTAIVKQQEIRQRKIPGSGMDLASATRLVLAIWSKANDFLARKPTHSNDIM